ncbi:hypothetical protein HDU93_003457, partial [Gonapodya sp. JEL0774]
RNHSLRRHQEGHAADAIIAAMHTTAKADQRVELVEAAGSGNEFVSSVGDRVRSSNEWRADNEQMVQHVDMWRGGDHE